ncbi:hypothetical protein XH99_10840 [Bradyrhizobium nanningense]|uniref:Uncharacterized protein n=2 Tax=Bradyrhizobium nanningense TaxID=1325118 RepID=A0A4Q0S6R6_9BRAD|nr:hypothetical protein XH84_20790 [Bradyrhizobium nanningense]RXH31431.1 hypothetical protein XH99_10840 [Bradyrhizobium nanningense]
MVHFTSTSKRHLLLYELPFIITIFDGCHRGAREFPEVRTFGEFERSEILFGFESTKAAIVIVNAPELIRRSRSSLRHGTGARGLHPFSPSAYASQSTTDEADDAAVLAKYRLEPG